MTNSGDNSYFSPLDPLSDNTHFSLSFYSVIERQGYTKLHQLSHIIIIIITVISLLVLVALVGIIVVRVASLFDVLFWYWY